MRKHYSLSLNGRATSASAFVKDKTAHALATSNLWSVTENNSNNSWNVNFNNGNTNNNKNNSTVGRAVAALGEEELAGWIEAADDCCRRKKTGMHCTQFRIREEVLVDLALAVKNRAYEPQAGCGSGGAGCVFVQFVHGISRASCYLWLAPQDVRTDEVVLEGGLRFGSLFEGFFTEEICVSSIN